MSKVGIIMGSKSDLPIMQQAIDILKSFEIDIKVDVLSAHRVPEKVFEYAILQMPGGIPVATVALDGAHNAGILAAQIIGSSDESVRNKIMAFKENLKNKVLKINEDLQKSLQ